MPVANEASLPGLHDSSSFMTGAQQLLPILIADDDPPIRALLVALLRREDLVVEVACDGAEAIALLDRQDYRLVILDIMMPRISGLGVIQHLVHRQGRARPPIIVMTAASSQFTDQVPTEHVNSVISKPFNIRVLIDAVHTALDSRPPIDAS